MIKDDFMKPTEGCHCRRCSALSELRAAYEDETLHPRERTELVQDLRSSLHRLPPCLKKDPKGFIRFLVDHPSGYDER